MAASSLAGVGALERKAVLSVLSVGGSGHRDQEVALRGIH